MADRAGLAFFGVRYADDFSWWRVTPLNTAARHIVPQQEHMSEDAYVALLRRLRGLARSTHHQFS